MTGPADDLIEAFRLRLEGPPRHVTIRTWRDDLADLVADVVEHSVGYGIACALGFTAGLFATVGLALVWSMFL